MSCWDFFSPDLIESDEISRLLWKNKQNKNKIKQKTNKQKNKNKDVLMITCRGHVSLCSMGLKSTSIVCILVIEGNLNLWNTWLHYVHLCEENPSKYIVAQYFAALYVLLLVMAILLYPKKSHVYFTLASDIVLPGGCRMAPSHYCNQNLPRLCDTTWAVVLSCVEDAIVFSWIGWPSVRAIWHPETWLIWCR